MKQIAEWRDIRKKCLGTGLGSLPHGRENEIKWRAPAEGKLKLNVDASVFTGSSSFTIGMVLRDHKRTFIQAKNLRSEGEVPVFEAEARTVLEALTWVQEMQVTNVEIESDSMLTVNTLTKKLEYYLEVGFVLQEFRSILSSRPDISASFVKKHANKVAHLLARVPCMVNCNNVFSSPPLYVLETVMYDSILL